ncbi:hypothetical protein D4764_10G0010830 [Takifugu flavidus]|uniref:Uncharacterized protein n=1 Tax=Takifugu flavidus TaxID=433684 RepID=A0A5C6PL05_9TELE|nr:hypothetical protein D4764_10G0010830 [Takifugu flavidus]
MLSVTLERRGKELRFARRLARNTAGEPARLHQHRADYILSDKPVKGEEPKEGKSLDGCCTSAVERRGEERRGEERRGEERRGEERRGER